MNATAEVPAPQEYEGERSVFWEWVLTHDHKKIGIMYAAYGVLFFLIGGLLALGVRGELAAPGPTFFSSQVYDVLFTMHGTLMIFGFAIPMGGALANFLIPLMIGAEDMAFPKVNAFSLWMLVVAGFAGILAIFFGADAGWTSYPPFSAQSPFGENMWAMAILMWGAASVGGSINFITTTFKLRTKGLSFFRMPLLLWALMATAILVLLAIPSLTTAVLFLVLDRLFAAKFYVASAGGDPLLFQHLFWFYSHPAVYIMILPAMGAVTEIYPVFARKPVFGYKFIAYSSLAICGLGFLVWAHHMFVSGMNPALTIPFMLTTFLIAVPSGIKVFNWLGTVWGGSIRFKAPMKFALAFIILFVIGGLSGVYVASVPLDFKVTDTYFIVAHIHYVLFGGSLFGFVAAIYYWYPKAIGRMYSEKLASWHFWTTFIFFNLTFFPMHILGLEGMRRRVYDYPVQYADLNMFISICAVVLGLAQLFFVYNLVVSAYKGEKAPSNPWAARTLEWQCSSPPPAHSWGGKDIEVVEGPYDYGRSVNNQLGEPINYDETMLAGTPTQESLQGAD